MNGTIIAALPIAAMFGIAGYRVGTGRGRPVLGAVLGFALGLIGLGIFHAHPAHGRGAGAARPRAR